ncbi:MAG TPA: PQQ-binding-like beta-propeller repeat protein [Dehalococcoidia bacterium]|nr:PQQ-binding-like beta-propeller repeat protein [Dehalococcoidia bacterium]
MARPHPPAVLAFLALVMLGAAGCVGTDNPKGWAGPVVEGDLLVASTDKGKLSALDPADDFSKIWTFPSGDEEPELKLEAIYGTPVVRGGNVYFGAYDSKVYALNLADGKPVWDRPFDTDGPIVAGFAASETALYAASEDGNVYALDLVTGSPAWDRPFDTGAEVWATPLLAGDRLYVASVNGKLFALNATTGEPEWDRPFETGHGLISDPVLADGTVLVGGIDRELHAVNAESGEELWSFKTDNWFWGRPWVDDGTVYAPSLDGRLYALSLADGKPVWDAPFEAKEPLRSAPVLAGGTLVIVDKGGNVFGLDPAEGSKEWGPLELEKTVLADPAVLDGKVIVSAEGGDLFNVDPAAGSLVVTP